VIIFGTPVVILAMLLRLINRRLIIIIIFIFINFVGDCYSLGITCHCARSTANYLHWKM